MGCMVISPNNAPYETVEREENTIMNGTTKDDKHVNHEPHHQQTHTITAMNDTITHQYRKLPSISTNIDEHKMLLMTRENHIPTPIQTAYIEYILKNQSHDTECISYEDCTQLLRIINASKYYQQIASNNTNDKHEFIEFCANEYKLCLDDYIHLITEHSDDLIKIANDLEIKCSVINECEYTKRHYSNYDKLDNDYKYNFYVQLFDTIHFYIFHLEDLALRTKCKSFVDTNKYDDENYLNSIDQQIVDIQNEIESKNKQCVFNFDRLNRNKNKRFMIEQTECVNYYGEKNGMTFMDQMMDYIRDSCGDELKEDILADLSLYITSEEYDTDSIVSNIGNILLYGLNNNVAYGKYMKQFIKYANISSNVLCTGFHFFYHKFYKNVEQNVEQNLFVCAHFKSIKEEVLNCGFIDMEEFENVIFKGDKFLDTNKCKDIKCIHGDDGIDVDPLHFNISYGALLKKAHIYSLILYCDYTAFCTSFLSTFRRMTANRHSKYYHIAKHLTEVIKYYGITGNWEHNEYENGPFYVGVSFCGYMDSFSIGFNAPVSTSKQKEIVIRLTDINGILLQLNNQQSSSQNEVFFDTLWISAFPEESEQVFWTFKYNIQIETIIKLQTKSNYHNIMQAYSKFDLMLSGKSVSNELITKNDVFIIKKSIEYVLDDLSSTNHHHLDEYILNNFYWFTVNKTKINLHLDSLYEIRDNSIVDLMMHSVKRIDYLEIEDNNHNLFKPLIFKLFKNVEQIVIRSSTDCYNVYAFNMLSLLSILMDISLPKSLRRIIIKDEFPLCSIQWLQNIFSEQIKNSFVAKQLNIELLTKQGCKLNEDWIIIDVMNY